MPWGIPASTGRGKQRVPLITTLTAQVEESRILGMKMVLYTPAESLASKAGWQTVSDQLGNGILFRKWLIGVNNA